MKALGFPAKFDVLDYSGGDGANGLPAEPMPGYYRQLVGIEIRWEFGVCAGVQYFVVEIRLRGWYMNHVVPLFE